MLSMQRVNLEDIRPDANNPRKKFAGLDALAESFAFTPDRPGEPMNPIVVAQDGNVFRIIDGERRFRAMKEAGKVQSCLCVVADSIEDADSIAMMLTTDNKEKLTMDERAMGVQTMLYLGVDEEKAASLSGRSDVNPESFRRIGRRIRQKSGYKPVQMDLTTLLELADIEDDAEVNELLGLALSGTDHNSDFYKRKSEIINRDKGRRRHAAFMESFVSLGVKVVEEKPSDDEWVSAKRIWYSEQKSVADAIEGFEDGEFIVYLEPVEAFEKSRSSWDHCPMLYMPKVEGVDESAAERERHEQAVNAQLDRFYAYEKRMEDHVTALVREGRMQLMLEGDDACQHLADVVWKAFEESDAMLALGDFDDGIEPEPHFPPYVFAYAWNELGLCRFRSLAVAIVDDEMTDEAAEDFEDYREILQLLKPTGYVMDSDELADLQALEAMMEDREPGGE